MNKIRTAMLESAARYRDDADNAVTYVVRAIANAIADAFEQEARRYVTDEKPATDGELDTAVDDVLSMLEPEHGRHRE